MEPLDKLQSRSLSKDLQEVHGDVAEDDSEPSDSQDADIPSSKPIPRAKKSLFYGM